MKHPAHCSKYLYVRKDYPEELHMKCPHCGAPVKYCHPDDGKLVHCLDEVVNQVIKLYTCTNPTCEFSHLYFNPTARFDYGGRSWGIDVLKFIAEEFLPPLKQKPEQILVRLHKLHPLLEISLDSVQRICDDILELKAFRIDEKTMEIIRKQRCILLGFDGQDPGLWCFKDLLSNRVLATMTFDKLDYNVLHEYLEELFKHFHVPVLGWVSDKQGVIVTCHDTYYKEIPHQYCQYHFLDHLWDNLECLDSHVFIPLKICLDHLYIHTASLSAKVFFEGQGKVSPRIIFQQVDDDFQRMTRARNKTFKILRGQWIYEELTKYLADVRVYLANMNPEYRMSKITKNFVEIIQAQLDSVRSYYEEGKQLQQWFQKIRTEINNEDQPWQESQRKIDGIFQEIVQDIHKISPKFNLEKCTAFQPSKSHSLLQVLGEYCRLWNSYLPGLFKYKEFPGRFRTNNGLENAFSKEKQELIARVGKGIVNHMIITRGDAYLRLSHCTSEELQTDILLEYEETLVKIFRKDLQKKIQANTKDWGPMTHEFRGFQGAFMVNYPSTDTSVRC